VGSDNAPFLFNVFPVRITTVGLCLNEHREALIAIGVINSEGDPAVLALDQNNALALQRELNAQVPGMTGYGGYDPGAN